jgi:hypothetical protein
MNAPCQVRDCDMGVYWTDLASGGEAAKTNQKAIAGRYSLGNDGSGEN